MDVELKPADVVLTRGTSRLDRLIRFFTRKIGESRTKVNHAALVVEGGGIQEAIIIEALSRVRKHRLYGQYGGKGNGEVAIYRPVDMPEEGVAEIVRAADRYLNMKYGYFKILLHLLDWFLLGAYVFRRLGKMDPYPICSWLVVYAYNKAGWNFGVPVEEADPDDIWDYVNAHPEKFQCVYPLAPL
jgi:hypothetical protein